MLLQPTLVPITEYIFELIGLDKTIFPFKVFKSLEGNQLYVDAPLTLKIWFWSGQIDADEGEILSIGFGKIENVCKIDAVQTLVTPINVVTPIETIFCCEAIGLIWKLLNKFVTTKFVPFNKV